MNREQQSADHYKEGIDYLIDTKDYKDETDSSWKWDSLTLGSLRSNIRL